MATTTLYGLHYPAATDQPDGAGALQQLAIDVEATLEAGTWAPGVGGTGAALGSTGGTSGKYFRVGKHWWLTGKIVFGTSASFGSTNFTVANLPVAMDVDNLVGDGWWESSSSFMLPFTLRPASTQSLEMRTHQVSGSNIVLAAANASVLGTPPQSSVLKFRIRGAAV